MRYASYLNELLADLTVEERPPTWMWPLPWEMDRHLEGVRVARDAKYGKPDSSTGGDSVADNGGVVGDRNALVDDFFAGVGGPPPGR